MHLGGTAFIEQHRNDRTGTAVTELLAELLFMIGNSVLFDQPDEVPRRVARQRGPAEVRFFERKFSGPAWTLVKLQRPPPDIAIFLPTRSLCSSRATRRPRCPAVSAHIIPAAPPPMTTTSNTEEGTEVIGS
jgi:hypothetical protein